MHKVLILKWLKLDSNVSFKTTQYITRTHTYVYNTCAESMFFVLKFHFHTDELSVKYLYVEYLSSERLPLICLSNAVTVNQQ